MCLTVISVKWNGLDLCKNVNGLIVLYRVQYREIASGVVRSKDVAGEWNVTEAEISLTGLTPSTMYSIQVAAVNEEGDVGLYSDPLIRQTLGYYSEYTCTTSLYITCITPLMPFTFTRTESAVTESTVGVVTGVIGVLVGIVVGVSGLIAAFIIVRKQK